MREYGQIQSAFWHSNDCQAMSGRAKLLACYLMTGPYTNGVGCFRISDGTIVDDLGWSTEVIETLFDELSRMGFAFRREKVVFMPAFLRWNKIANGNIAKARFSEWEQIPSGTVKCHAARAMLEFSDQWSEFHLERLNESAKRVTETLFSNSETRKEPNPLEPIRTQPSLVRSRKPKPPVDSTRFDEFYSAYPRKIGKAKAAQAFAKLKLDDALFDTIMAALAAQAKSEKWRLEPQYIPHPSTWINGKRWEDAVENGLFANPAPRPPTQTLSAIQRLQEQRHAILDRSGNPQRSLEAPDAEPEADARPGFNRRHRHGVE